MFSKYPQGASWQRAIRLLAFGGLGLGLALLALCLVLAAARRAATGTQSVSFRIPAVTVDLGSQLPGQLLRRQWPVPNPGSASIRITRIVTSCGCLQSTLQPLTIPPGKTGVLNFAIATRPWSGPALVTATLTGIAGSAVIVRRYLIRYTVRRPIRIVGAKDTNGEPYYLDLGKLSLGSKPRPFRVFVRRGTYPARWDSLRCAADNPVLGASVKKIGLDSWALSLAPRGLTILGSQSYQLRFSFYRGGKELPFHYSQPVNFKVEGPVELEPDSVFFGPVPYGSTMVRRLRLVTSATGRSGSGRIVSAKSPIPGGAAISVNAGGTGLRAAFHAAAGVGQITGRYLITAEYGGSFYRFRVDYLAYVTGKPEAK